MDHDKLQMTSETEEKGNSSTSDNNASGLISGEEHAGSNSEGNDATRMLQPFFVADTLEDDESIIAPSQEDSELLIPSTPAYENKSEKRSENVDANESTISILEETCVLEKKTHLNDSSGENAVSAACNESDMTQDLAELEQTQPIIPSNVRIDHSFAEESNNTNKNKVDEEEDDEWQLKFSETQTQEILMNYQKNDQSDEEAETQKLLPMKNDEPGDDDDLPATQSIEVPQIDDGEEDYCKKSKKPEIKENLEVLETQSDDEIEPSQSCLSEYKGETISTSFKVQSVETSNEEIPKLCSEKETKKDDDKSDMDITMIDETEKRTITLSESQPKNILNDTKDTVQEKSAEKDKNYKNMAEQEQSVSDVNEKRTTNSEFGIKPIEENSVECNISNESAPKISDEKSPKMTETNGNQMEEIDIFDDVVNVEIESKKLKSPKFMGKKETKSKVIEPGANDIVINLEENIEMKKENRKSDEEKSNSIETIKNKVENNVEAMEIDEEKEQKVLRSAVDNKSEINEIVSITKEVESTKQEQKIVVPESKLEQESDMHLVTDTKTTDSQGIKSGEIVLDSEPSKISCENLKTSPKHIPDDEKTETPPKLFAKPAPGHHFGLLGKQKGQIPCNEIPNEKSEKKVASYKNVESLQHFFTSLGVTVDPEKLDSILSKPNEEVEFRPVFKIVNFEIFLKGHLIENYKELQRRESGISPVYSSSTATSSTLSSKLSGEVADISSLSSGDMFPKTSSQKSPKKKIATPKKFASFHPKQSGEGEIADISFSPGDTFPKTSTQKSPKKTGELLKNFEGKGLGEASKTNTNVSPVLSEQSTKSTAAKRKRGGKKNVASSSSDVPNTSEPKNKRAKGKGKSKTKIVEDKSDETEESKDITPEEKPKKPTRRKKRIPSMPDIKPEDIKTIIESIETTTTDDDDALFQEDANFGTILPGCKVMARWKDGYYYSGMVQSQELDGKWAVLFEDGFLRTISPECLIKIAILPKGTSVLVQSPDDYFDPGIVCGHFREGNKVGYEVELDNGVTRRYTRSAVILSNDQAKLVMKNAPPTTPPTMTINLDNIIDGKRKRKSIQSPVVSSPPVKKSARITRSRKIDPNLDSTEDSNASEVVPEKSVDKSVDKNTDKCTDIGSSKSSSTIPSKSSSTITERSSSTISSKNSITITERSFSTVSSKSSSTITEKSSSTVTEKSKDSGISLEEPPMKKKKTKKGAISTAASPIINETCSDVSMPSTSSTSKTKKVLPQRSAKKEKFLFKDYAFLLTNAERKTVSKPTDTSDSDITKEEEDIVPFDKDELCKHINAGGGVILEKFDDYKKCTRKYTYLLANSYLRTMKYIQCIAAGISCIKHHWVQNCIFKSEILSLNSYILPAGYSIVTQQVIEWHGKTDIFKDCKIALVSAPESPFVYTWAPVLLAAKADFVQKWSLPTSVSGCSLVVDVLITNNHCPSDIIQSAKKRKIPIVSSEWIIQCLIMGKTLPYDAHPKFKHDYTE